MGLWAEASVRHVLAEVVAGWREAREQREDALAPPGGRAPAGPAGAPAPVGACRARPPSCAPASAWRCTCSGSYSTLWPAPHRPRRRGLPVGPLRLLAVDGTTLDVADKAADAHALAHQASTAGRGRSLRCGWWPLIETSTPCPVRRGAAALPGRGGPGGAAAARCVAGGAPTVGPRLRRVRVGPAHAGPRRRTSWGAPRPTSCSRPTEVLPDGSFLLRPLPLAHGAPAPGGRDRRCGWWSTPWTPPPGPAAERYRLLTSLLDPRAFPAAVLAATYHERWEVETALAEVKVHQWAHPRPLRSKHPRGGGPGGLRPAPGPPGHPHPDVPGRPAGPGRPRPAQLHRARCACCAGPSPARSARRPSDSPFCAGGC